MPHWPLFTCNQIKLPLIKIQPIISLSSSLSHAFVDFLNNPDNNFSSYCHGWPNQYSYTPFPIPAACFFLKEMNSTADSGGLLNNVGGFGYGIGVSIGILLLITTITLASYFCTRTDPRTMAPATQRTLPQHPIETHDYVVDVGLDEATILSYPKLLYSEAKLKKTDSTATCCSICLADYKSTDMLRLLPDCGHLFHLKCVDPWLRLNPTCPVCRTSPLPTPLSTPLAEVVPLASRRDW